MNMNTNTFKILPISQLISYAHRYADEKISRIIKRVEELSDYVTYNLTTQVKPEDIDQLIREAEELRIQINNSKNLLEQLLENIHKYYIVNIYRDRHGKSKYIGKIVSGEYYGVVVLLPRHLEGKVREYTAYYMSVEIRESRKGNKYGIAREIIAEETLVRSLATYLVKVRKTKEKLKDIIDALKVLRIIFSEEGRQLLEKIKLIDEGVLPPHTLYDDKTFILLVHKYTAPETTFIVEQLIEQYTYIHGKNNGVCMLHRGLSPEYTSKLLNVLVYSTRRVVIPVAIIIPDFEFKKHFTSYLSMMQRLDILEELTAHGEIIGYIANTDSKGHIVLNYIVVKPKKELTINQIVLINKKLLQLIEKYNPTPDYEALKFDAKANIEVLQLAVELLKQS